MAFFTLFGLFNLAYCPKKSTNLLPGIAKFYFLKQKYYYIVILYYMHFSTYKKYLIILHYSIRILKFPYILILTIVINPEMKVSVHMSFTCNVLL